MRLCLSASVGVLLVARVLHIPCEGSKLMLCVYMNFSRWSLPVSRGPECCTSLTCVCSVFCG